MAERGRWLVLDLDGPPEDGGPVRAALARVGGEVREVDAGWARFAAVELADGGGRRAGDAALDLGPWRALPGVRRAWLQDDVVVLAGRSWRNGDDGFTAAGWRAGGPQLLLIAGPCAVESRAQMHEVAAAAAEAGVRWLRGGAWKPRSSPYDFQGLGPRGLELLREAADAHGLAVITEVMGVEELPGVVEASDVLQVGARNAQNFPLLRQLGRYDRPVFLKRGFGCTVQEMVHAAEYVMSSGNPRVLLCERGIRSFETATRFTFDINAIPWLKQRVHLPVIADPSHGTGDASLVEPVARAALAAGADGLMIEVHPDPARARSDGPQALVASELGRLVRDLAPLVAVLGRRL